jgi:hypothetical protein
MMSWLNDLKYFSRIASSFNTEIYLPLTQAFTICAVWTEGYNPTQYISDLLCDGELLIMYMNNNPYSIDLASSNNDVIN